MTRTRVRFAIYSDEPVPGWPANYRRLMRDGTMPASDVQLQVFTADEVAFLVQGFEPILLSHHAVALTDAGPAIVPKPD